MDARFFFTPERAFSTVASYGDAARFWIRIYLTWDIVNPILYTLAFSLLISWLFQRGFKPESKLQMLNVLPAGAGLFDLLENIGIVTLLAIYPAQPVIVAWLSTVCTMIKVSFLGVSTLLILIGLVKAARKSRLCEHPWLSLLAVMVTSVLSIFLTGTVIFGLIGLSDDSPTVQFIQGMSYHILTGFILAPFVLRLPKGKRTFGQYLDDIRLSRIQPFVRLVLLALSCYVILALSQAAASIVYRISEGLPIPRPFSCARRIILSDIGSKPIIFAAIASMATWSALARMTFFVWIRMARGPGPSPANVPSITAKMPG